MTKAEERALENYPVEMVSGPIGYEEPKFDLNAFGRHIFQEGYEQAEEDNELTIEDLELLHTFLCAVKNNKKGAFTFTRLSDEQYKEVLRRFQEAKK